MRILTLLCLAGLLPFWSTEAYCSNVALGKTATANSTWATQYPSLAVDGNYGGLAWAASGHGSEANPYWLKIDLGEVFEVQNILLVGSYSAYYENYSVVYKLYGSIDDTNWTLLSTGTLYDTANWDSRTDSVTPEPADASMRYVRFDGVGGSHWTQLGEIEVHAVPEPSTAALLALGNLS